MIVNQLHYMNLELVLELVYDYADIDTRIAINNAVRQSQRFVALSFVEARHKFAQLHPERFATLYVHPDCAEVRWYDGSYMLQPQTIYCNTYVSPLWFSKLEPNNPKVNSLDWERRPKATSSIHLQMMEVLFFCQEIESIDFSEVDTRHIPSYMLMLDARIACEKNYYAYISQNDDKQWFNRDRSVKSTLDRITRYEHIKGVISCHVADTDPQPSECSDS